MTSKDSSTRCMSKNFFENFERSLVNCEFFHEHGKYLDSGEESIELLINETLEFLDNRDSRRILSSS